MTTASDIVAQLDRLYTASVSRLQAALNAYLVDGIAPDPQTRQELMNNAGVTAVIGVLWTFVLVLFWGNACEQIEYSEY